MARRLVAIMFTDIAGYTQLSQTDEPGALRLLQEQEKLVRPLLADVEQQVMGLRALHLKLRQADEGPSFGEVVARSRPRSEIR